MKRVVGVICILAAIGAFVGWWAADQIDSLDRWRK